MVFFPKVALVALVVSATLTFNATAAVAFDTGPHASMTIDALMHVGFSKSAADVVQVENWLTDYYTSTPTLSKADQCDLEKLHFDDVFTTADATHYWANLTANTKAAIQKADRDNDPVEFFVALGISLHVVQDFYAHSNWVETLPVTAGHYSTATWFETATPPSTIHTGWYDNCLGIAQGTHTPHGGYTSGMNHDSVVRPNYDRAYVCGYAASYEWARNALGWLSSAFKAKVLTYAPSAADASDLAFDQKASIYISEWVENPVNVGSLDGHWNGNRSGYAGAFALFAAAWIANHDSIFVASFKTQKIYAALSKNLYTTTTATMPAMTAYPRTGTVFAMRTVSVYANSAITGTDSYYGQLVATNMLNGDSPYRDASQYHLPRTSVPWLQLMWVKPGQNVVSMKYTLWNEFGNTNNDMVPIKGTANTLTFTCTVSSAACTGDVSGGPWSAANPFSTTGSGLSGVKVVFYFTSSSAAP
jgi:hypothetical protein